LGLYNILLKIELKRGRKMGKSLSKILSRFEEFVLGYSVIIMAVILIGNVISRKVFNYSWAFSEEVGSTLTMVVTFFGISYAAKKAKHITMSALYDLVSTKYKKIMTTIICGGTCLAMIFVGYYSLKYTLKIHELGRVTPSLRIPMEYIIAVLPLGFLLGAIEYGRSFIKNLTHKEIWISSEETIRIYNDDKAGKNLERNIEVSVQMNNQEVK
jgi:C4-dicarboxylate transporter, DctQ subunit